VEKNGIFRMAKGEMQRNRVTHAPKNDRKDIRKTHIKKREDKRRGGRHKTFAKLLGSTKRNWGTRKGTEGDHIGGEKEYQRRKSDHLSSKIGVKKSQCRAVTKTIRR